MGNLPRAVVAIGIESRMRPGYFLPARDCESSFILRPFARPILPKGGVPKSKPRRTSARAQAAKAKAKAGAKASAKQKAKAKSKA